MHPLLQKIGLGYTLGDFFTNSSGHPALGGFSSGPANLCFNFALGDCNRVGGSSNKFSNKDFFSFRELAKDTG
jgi:hypothetical protein